MRSTRPLLLVAALAAAAPLLAAPPAARPAGPVAPASASASALAPLPCRASKVRGGALRLRWSERATKVRECQNTAASSEHEREVAGDRVEGLLADGVRWKVGDRVRSIEGTIRGWVAETREVSLEEIDVVAGYAGARRERWGQALRFAVVVSVKHQDNGMCHAWTSVERYRGTLVVRQEDAAIVSLTLRGSGQRSQAVCQPDKDGMGPARLCSTSVLGLELDRACAP